MRSGTIFQTVAVSHMLFSVLRCHTFRRTVEFREHSFKLKSLDCARIEIAFNWVCNTVATRVGGPSSWCGPGLIYLRYYFATLVPVALRIYLLWLCVWFRLIWSVCVYIYVGSCIPLQFNSNFSSRSGWPALRIGPYTSKYN